MQTEISGTSPLAKFIIDALCAEPGYERIAEHLSSFAKAGKKFRSDPLLATGMGDTPRAAAIFSLGSDNRIDPQLGTSVILVPDEKTAYSLQRQLSAFTDKVCVFSQRDYVFHNVSATSREFEYERLSALKKMTLPEEERLRFVICVPEALLCLLPPKSLAISELKIEIGSEYPQNELLSKLSEFGYTRAETVEGKGQFAVRGDILDIFPPAEENPIRVEFFGDEADGAGYFDVLTQRRTENLQSFVITPAREVLLTEEERARAASAIDSLILGAKKRMGLYEKAGNALKIQDEENLIGKLLAEKEALQSGELPCIDKYLPQVRSEKTTLFDYAEGSLFIFDMPRVKERIASFEKEMSETLTFLAEAGEIDLKTAGSFCEDYEFLCAEMRKRPTLVFNTFSQSSGVRFAGIFDFRTKTPAPFTHEKSADVVGEDAAFYTEAGYKTVMLAHSAHSAGVLCSILSDRGIKAVLISPAELRFSLLSDRHVTVTFPEEGFPPLPGFELPVSHTALLTESTGEAASPARKKGGVRGSKTKKMLSYSDLSVGDFVVHSVHGIGRYDGIKTLTVGGVTRDYVSVVYAGNDVMYVPADQLDRLSRYAGAGENVHLSKLGTPDWQKTKTRVKKAARDMAKELIKLYAERRRLPGHAFASDGEWQKDFEAKFPYDETEGQLCAVREIKADMEETYPMDRLLCGDVGFGKTEVALRAVFKCIAEGKQAAILVPTTILAWQHYETAFSRFCDFPVNMDVLSRFKTAKETKEILKKLKTGELDLVIGTHRLLSKDIEFRDLGLLVIDEEQRFGVAHKEKLKQLSKNVDVLTLTATPIPRTLNMAMAGIRDMSVLDEAPQDRYPVQTYVTEHDYEMIGDAIRRELRRGGQVFYLRNRVDGIEGIAQKLHTLVPDARIAIAHGQMTEELLSDIWREMVSGEIDVLVCTTIIETGVDVPNANTLIIENADRMGLSQLHQIRGRVGRSNRRAYAYFTYDGSKALSEVAQKRLEAVREYTEFGSGFKIAMRDLEIRGAGNLLGAEQSGHLEAVGYDLYIKLLEEAVLEEKGEGRKKRCECTVEFGKNAYIPEKYISNPGARIEAYKKIAAIDSGEDADDVTDELLDRYGDMPKPVTQLIYVSLVRSLGEKHHIKRVEYKAGRLNFYPEAPDRDVLLALYGKFAKALLFTRGASPCYSIKLLSEEELSSVCDTFFSVLCEREKLLEDEKQDTENANTANTVNMKGNGTEQ